MKKIVIAVMVTALLGFGFAGSSKGGTDFGRVAPGVQNVF